VSNYRSGSPYFNTTAPLLADSESLTGLSNAAELVKFQSNN
jgi:hypothetical protein